MLSQRGYTFLELLIVIAILAVLLAVGYNGYRKVRWRAEVREGIALLASTLRDARSLAQRYNVTARVEFPAPRKFSLKAEDSSGNTYREYQRGIPPYLELHYTKNTKTWKLATALGKVSYTPPFGETGAGSTLFRVRHVRDTKIAACLRIVGVTGKVVVARACP